MSVSVDGAISHRGGDRNARDRSGVWGVGAGRCRCYGTLRPPGAGIASIPSGTWSAAATPIGPRRRVLPDRTGGPWPSNPPLPAPGPSSLSRRRLPPLPPRASPRPRRVFGPARPAWARAAGRPAHRGTGIASIPRPRSSAWAAALARAVAGARCLIRHERRSRRPSLRDALDVQLPSRAHPRDGRQAVRHRLTPHVPATSTITPLRSPAVSPRYTGHVAGETGMHNRVRLGEAPPIGALPVTARYRARPRSRLYAALRDGTPRTGTTVPPGLRTAPHCAFR